MISLGAPTPRTTPSSIQMTRSQMDSSVSRSCETTRIVPCSAKSLIKASHLAPKASSPTESASSTIKISASACAQTAKASRAAMRRQGDAPYDLDEIGFSGAVPADDPNSFAAANLEGDVPQDPMLMVKLL